MRVGKYDHVGCLAHTIHLAVGAGLGTTDASELLARCKKIVSHFKHSPLEYEKLKHELDNDGKEHLKFIQSCITRWDSIYDMLLRLQILMPSICKVLSLPENRKYQCLLLTHEENQKTDDLIILLGKFKTATKTICNENILLYH